MSGPRLSVIIPSYQSASFLPACVSSIRTAGEPDVEVIVVDDGSKDNTREVAESLGVKYIYQANQRQAVARNTGLTIATGKYVGFLDADDTWKPGVLPEMLDLLDRHNELAVTFSDAEMGNPETGYISMQKRITQGKPEFWTLPSTNDGQFRVFEQTPFRELLMHRNLVFMGTAIMRHDFLRNTRGFEPRTIGAEDWHMCIQMSRFGTFAYTNTPLAVYIQHGHNFSQNTDVMVKGFCEVRRTLLEYPEDLSPECQKILRAGLKMESQYYADLAFGRGDYPVARQRYRQVRKESGTSRAVLHGLLMTSLPNGIIRRLRGLKK